MTACPACREMGPERLERVGPCWLLKLRWMGTQRVQLTGVFLGWFVAGTNLRLLSCPGCTGQPSTKYFFPHHTLFQFTVCVPIAQQPEQAVVQGRLSLNESLLIGQMNWNSVRWGRKYFVLGVLVQLRQDENLFYWHEEPKRSPLTCTPWALIYLSFNCQKGPPLLSFSGGASFTFLRFFPCFVMILMAISFLQLI